MCYIPIIYIPKILMLLNGYFYGVCDKMVVYQEIILIYRWDSPSTSFWGTHIAGNLHMGLSENSVPLHPMVNDHYPY